MLGNYRPHKHNPFNCIRYGTGLGDWLICQLATRWTILVCPLVPAVRAFRGGGSRYF